MAYYKNKKIISILLSLTLISSISVPATAKEMDNTKELNKAQIIEKFKSKSNGDLKFTQKGGQVFLSGKLTDKQVAGQKAADKFLEDNKQLFGLDNISNDLKEVEEKKDEVGDTFVKYVQVINGTEVNGRYINVHFDKNGVIVSTNGNLEKDKNITTLSNKNISEGEAVEIAKKQYKFKSLKKPAKAEKIILNNDSKNYEVYKVNIAYMEPTIANYSVYVEAHSGEVIKTENNIKYDGPTTGTGRDVQGNMKNLKLYLTSSKYYMRDMSKSYMNGIYTYSLNHDTVSGTLVSNSNSIFDGEDYKASVSAHYNADKVISFYKNLFGRNSLDNKGLEIDSYTHYDNNYNNAFWDGDEMVYGDGDGSEFTYLSGDLGVVGHEMTHGLIDNTANLYYHNQSGALNESMADVFGVLIKTYDKYNVENGGTWTFDPTDWVVGEKVYTPSIAGDALRSLANPTLYGQPGSMNNYQSLPDTKEGDNGGVHENSGITNKAAYLIAKSLGMQKTAKIYYSALANYMGMDTDFEGAKDFLVQAASSLYGANSAEAIAVTNSFAAVGVGQATDFYESNDTMQNAYAINPGITYQAYITQSSDVDFYKINVNTPGNINIKLLNLPGNYDLEVYDPNGQLAGSSYNSGNLSEGISLNASQTGDYYIKVFSNNDYSTTDKYCLLVTKSVASISLDKTSLSLDVGASANLIATVLPSDAANKNITWSSSNAAVVAVDSIGKVTAKGEGNAIVTVTTSDGGYKATCNVSVQSVPVAGVILNTATAQLKTGQTMNLAATISPSNATNKNLLWSSSNTSLLGVDSTGKVTAKGIGTAKVTVITADGNYSASCTFTITQSVIGVSLDKTTVGLKVGETTNLIATVNPTNAYNSAVTWSSSNTSVAVVDATGKVTAKALGNATITVTTKEGSYKANCSITVYQIPSAPIGLQALSAGYDSAKISWGAVTGASGYEIYRSLTSNGTYSLVAQATGTSYTNSGLTTNGTYYYRVRAYVSIGTTKVYGNYSSTVSVKPVLSVPISCLVVSNSYNSIKLSWGTVAGASGYEVYKASSSSGTYTKLTELTALTYTNAGLSTGVTYYYKIRAYRTVGTTRIYGNFTSVLSAKPIPSIPSSVYASCASYTSNKIGWGVVSGASGYEIYRSTSSTGTYGLIASTTALSYVNAGLSTGTTYYYKVRAYTTVGVIKVYSLYSGLVSAKPVPSVPQAVKAVPTSYNTATISWGKVGEATGYEVLRSTASTGNYTVVSTTTALSYNNTALSTGITYYYMVRAYRLLGSTKVYSNPSGVVSARTVPAAPAGLYASLSTYNSIKLGWNAAGGANGYEIYRATSSTGAYTLITSTTSTNYLNSGLPINVTYYYKVRAYTMVGTVKVYGGYSSVVSKATRSAYSPQYSMWISAKEDLDASLIVLHMTNKGPTTMRIYSSNSALSDDEYYDYDRDLQLVNENTFADIPYIDIPSGGSVYICFRVKGDSTRYNNMSTVYFDFTYDGLWYRGSASSYYGMHYSKK